MLRGVMVAEKLTVGRPFFRWNDTETVVSGAALPRVEAE